MGNTSDSQNRAGFDYIRKVLSETGLRPTVLAKKAGISASTITRALHNPEGFGGFNTTTIRKIYEATDVMPDTALLGAIDMPQNLHPLIDEEGLVACMEVIEEWLEAKRTTANLAAKSRVIAVGLWPELVDVRKSENRPSIDEIKDHLRTKINITMRMAGIT